MSSDRNATFRATLLVGGAAMISMLFGLVRTKVAALLLGPAGIGMIGLLQNLVSLAANLASLGIGNSATRQLAATAADEDQAQHRAARRALVVLAALLASMGSLVVYLACEPIAAFMLDRPDLAGALVWLAPAVGLTVVASAQSALLTGLKKTATVALVSVLSALVATLGAVTGVLLGGPAAGILFVLSVPLAAVLVSSLVIARVVRQSPGAPPRWSAVRAQGRAMVLLGAGFMGAMLISSGAQLIARVMITDSTGLEGAGQFQAAWIISMTYMGLILQAASTDYFPRLSEAVARGDNPSTLLNHQLEVTLLLALPLLLVAMAFAPLIVTVMYSSDFTRTADILRWQVVGDLLKLISWPIGFILIAQGRSLAFIVAEFAGAAAFLLALWLGLPRLGLEATGVAYLAMFAVYLLVVIGLARSRTALHLTRRSTAWIVGGLLSLGMLALLVRLSPVLAMAACVAAVGVIGWIGWGEIRQLLGRKATVHEGPPKSTASELD